MRLGSPDTVAGPRAWPGAARPSGLLLLGVARRTSTPGCHFPFTRSRGHPPAFRYSGVTTYILAQPPILAKTAMSKGPASGATITTRAYLKAVENALAGVK